MNAGNSQGAAGETAQQLDWFDAVISFKGGPSAPPSWGPFLFAARIRIRATCFCDDGDALAARDIREWWARQGSNL
jgi:hypothetical protein